MPASSATLRAPAARFGAREARVERRPTAPPEVQTVGSTLSWTERLALLVGIVEIPLQLDKYFMWHQEDAALGSIGGINISLTTIALVYLYGIWMLDGALKRRRTLAGWMIGVPMVAYLATVVLSIASASVPMLTVFDASNVFQAYLLFFFIANRVQSHQDVMFMVLVLAATLLIQACVIFFASLIGMDGEERAFGPLMLAVHEGKRHAGSMHSPVLAGSTMALIWLPVASALMFVRVRWAWTLLATATALGMLAILMTQTRGALLTSAIGGIIIGVGMLSRGWLPKWTLPMAVLMGVMSLYPMYMIYKKRIEHGDGESAIARKHLSLIAMEVIAKEPILGYGGGNCHLAARDLANQGIYRAEWYFTIHCKYLLVWIETGLIGLIAFLAVLGTGYRYGIATWRKYDTALSPLGLALFAALAGHSVHMLVDVFNSRTQVQILWVILGLSAAVYRLAIRTNISTLAESFGHLASPSLREGRPASGRGGRGNDLNARPSPRFAHPSQREGQSRPSGATP